MPDTMLHRESKRGRVTRAVVSLEVATIIYGISYFSHIPSWADDLIQAALGGLLVFFLIEYEFKRIRDLKHRLYIEAEFNHHVRNAMHTILLAEQVDTENHKTIVVETSRNLLARLKDVSRLTLDGNQGRQVIAHWGVGGEEKP